MRKSWRWCPERRELVPIERSRTHTAHYVIPDTPEFRLPGSNLVISGRKAKREFMKRTGYEEVGNDRKGFEAETRKAREAIEARETRQLKETIADVCRHREFFRGR
jgi:hypothetical protein